MFYVKCFPHASDFNSLCNLGKKCFSMPSGKYIEPPDTAKMGNELPVWCPMDNFSIFFFHKTHL